MRNRRCSFCHSAACPNFGRKNWIVFANLDWRKGSPTPHNLMTSTCAHTFHHMQPILFLRSFFKRQRVVNHKLLRASLSLCARVLAVKRYSKVESDLGVWNARWCVEPRFWSCGGAIRTLFKTWALDNYGDNYGAGGARHGFARPRAVPHSRLLRVPWRACKRILPKH